MVGCPWAKAMIAVRTPAKAEKPKGSKGQAAAPAASGSSPVLSEIEASEHE